MNSDQVFTYGSESIPLCHSWERMAAKELSQILYGVTSGGFDNPQELSNRLADVQICLRELYGGTVPHCIDGEAIYSHE
jgi:hypothetical protein